MTLTRADLYIAVWEKPLAHVAAENECTVMQLSALCKQYDIPCPPKSYWHRSFERRLEVTRPGLPVSKQSARTPVKWGEEVKPQKRKSQSRLSPKQRHAQLLTVAHDVIVNEGLAACTISHVATKAEVSEALAFRYCRSRIDMLVDLAKREWAAQSASWGDQVNVASSSAEKFKTFVTSYMAHVGSHGSVLRCLLEVPEVYSEMEKLMSEQVSTLSPDNTNPIALAKTRALIAAQQRAGDLLANRKGNQSQCVNAGLAFTATPATN